MISAALLHPGNRLLNGGTTDLAMFGGQPTTTVDIGRAAAAETGYLTAFRPTPSSAGDGGAVDGSSRGDAFPLAYTPVSGTPADTGLAALGSPGALSVPPAVSSTAAPLVPTPSGAGSTATTGPLAGPLAQATAATATPADAVGVASPLSGAFGAPVLGAAGVTPAVADGALAITGSLAGSALGSAFAAQEAAGNLIGSSVDAVGTTLDAVAGQASYLADGVANHAASSVGDVAQFADATLQSVPIAVGALAAETTVAATAALDGVGSVAGDVSGVATSAAATAGEDVVTTAGETLDGVTDATADTAAAAQDSVATTVLPLVDQLAGGAGDPTDVLGGSDPVGGIATLTAMVSSADVFELPAGVVPAADAVTTAIDEVAPDGELAGPLLGEEHVLGDLPHHDDGALGIGGL